MTQRVKWPRIKGGVVWPRDALVMVFVRTRFHDAGLLTQRPLTCTDWVLSEVDKPLFSPACAVVTRTCGAATVLPARQHRFIAATL